MSKVADYFMPESYEDLSDYFAEPMPTDVYYKHVEKGIDMAAVLNLDFQFNTEEEIHDYN